MGAVKIKASNRSEWLAALSAVASGLLLASLFAPWEWTWAAGVALAPMFAAARKISERWALKYGYVTGLLFWLVSIRWLTHVTVAGWLFLAAYGALYFLPVAWLAHRWRGGALGFATALAVVWCGVEFFHGWLGGGFPWNPLGAGLSLWLPGIQLAEWGGVWLVSSLVVFANALVAWALAERRDWRGVGVGALLVALACGWGVWRVQRIQPGERSLRVALVQTAIPQDEKWVAAKVQMIYERLDELTRLAQEDPRVELVIWPETALPDDVRNSEASYALVAGLCTHGTPILTGSLDAALLDSGEPRYYNSAFLFDETGRLASEYDKRHLVIAGEFIPFERWIPRRWRDAWEWAESISPGEGSSIFKVGPSAIPLAPLICFEDILPYLARADVRAGARMLINLTNDAWFDEVAAPRQHMRNAVLRAVENRVPLVRVANTGISCVIAPSGKVTDELSDGGGRTWTSGVLWADVSAPADDAPLTFYARFGDMYGIACATATVFWLFSAWWRRRQKKTENPC